MDGRAMMDADKSVCAADCVLVTWQDLQYTVARRRQGLKNDNKR